jgi:transposase
MRIPKEHPTDTAMDANRFADATIKSIVVFLQLFISETLAKRLVSMVLIIAGASFPRIERATGFSKRSLHDIKKAVDTGDEEKHLVVGHGSGRRSKTEDLESAILREIEANNYHTHQQIADMIKEKFDVSMTSRSVGNFLKKTASSG